MKNALTVIMIDVIMVLSAYLAGTVVTLYVINKQSHGCMPVAKPKPVVLVVHHV